ncbi:MAG: hypothetical protein HFF70_14655 [Oscillospiraceae bacterium]|nr:hypothetical protein [Oscillospiraceae bacterium]
MERNDIINGLWELAKPDPEKCKSCGHENSCDIRGCAIIRAAVMEIEKLTSLEKVFFS